ncbi:plasmid IncI1-type surface exclusion protein ExcA (plasmid) [Candidatus Fukatsuia symbiotica]|uniref:Surface exclusion protein n=1 Tax=Candidatus Fukatsuia symbiotica TaxID=1878942 RepID=A0A2U8I8N7_9GAMM|nr:plasmid IncI1-type surface exclusion protein ExcA [Candidatus Fukatsuia symbiotica]AWK15483.1 surface exclusion protein [Candidatus Fukatsuia symbiotica]MEA9445868.1 plasmid IncI1-type surface exclusion protein ExcA [Candidatus Fukatsuia symbiotica]
MRNKKTIGGALMHLALFFYVWAGIPFFLFVSIMSFRMANNVYFRAVRDRDLLYANLSLAALVIPLLWCTISYINKRLCLAKILSVIKSDESYYPAPDNEIREMHSSAYFGIDPKRGTMLYVRLINKKEIDILGFNISNWRNCELRASNRLRLYINSAEMPFIDIQNNKAWLLYERICVMRNQQYNYPYNFPGYVKHNTERLSEKMGFKMLPC